MMTGRVRSDSIAASNHENGVAFFFMHDNKERPANCAQTPVNPDKNNNDKFQDKI
jgi:hypothetical protein